MVMVISSSQYMRAYRILVYIHTVDCDCHIYYECIHFYFRFMRINIRNIYRYRNTRNNFSRLETIIIYNHHSS